jgi:predicted dehydrogenase
MGGGHQTCRKLLDEKVIGTPFAAQAFFFCFGPEYFHPNPEFFYKKGAGPVLDWGPYYISSLVSLFGPVKKIVSMGRTPVPVRKALSESSPVFGKEFSVDVFTYVTSLLEFESGFTANVTVSFDMKYPFWESNMPFIRVFGTEGSIDVPDVNQYAGPVIVRDSKGFEKEYPLEFGFTENSRGMGMSDMARAITRGGQYRANGEFGLHVTEVLLKIIESAEAGEYKMVENSCKIPEPLSADTF